MESIEEGVDALYKPLPPLYFAFMLIWGFSAVSWLFNCCSNLDFQLNKLQWMLASVPWIKALQLSLSFLFWYSCFYKNICSLWMSFGVYIMGILFQTSAFVSFFLISHGYCITCHRLSRSEKRAMALLSSLFYFTLVGHRASLPYFSILLLLNYVIVFYTIFTRISQNLTDLSDQLNFIEDENIQGMQDAVYTKYIMFKKFQGAMHIVALSELVTFISADSSVESYWLRLLVREWGHLFVFMYIGWIFRSQQQLAPRFSVMPVLRSKGGAAVPPIYSIEMDARTFQQFRRHEWHIGVPTLPFKDSVVVVIQQPHASNLKT